MASPNPQNASHKDRHRGKRPMQEFLPHDDPSSDESSTTNASTKRKIDLDEESDLSSPKSNSGEEEEEKEVASSLIMLAGGGEIEGEGPDPNPNPNPSLKPSPNCKEKGKEEVKLKIYLCSMCKRAFESRQALGGHRASHKKVKGCYAVGKKELGENSGNKNVEDDDDNNSEEEIKGYTCDVCGRVFVNAQGLGAHKRVHTSQGNDQVVENYKFDLNLPPPQEDDEN